MPNYSYNLQYGDSEIDEVDEKGCSTARKIIAAFDRFDWSGEVQKANETQKCSPTFTVDDTDTGRRIWVSGWGDPMNPEFISAYCYPARKKAWFGLVERDGFDGPECRQDLMLAEAKQAIQLFLAEKHDELVALISIH